MKASELRIGNWIEHRNTAVRADVISEYKPASILISQCAPIPLTEEWIKKFGFKDETKPWYSAKFFQHESHNEWGIWMDEMVLYRNSETYIAEVRHVHQLQNLYFALTGEELTTKEKV